MVKTITAKEIAQKVINHEDLFIIDARNTDDFDDWKIEGGMKAWSEHLEPVKLVT